MNSQMIRYQVHFECTQPGSPLLKRSCRSIVARSESEAKARLRKKVPDAFGIWINAQANELV